MSDGEDEALGEEGLELRGEEKEGDDEEDVVEASGNDVEKALLQPPEEGEAFLSDDGFVRLLAVDVGEGVNFALRDGDEGEFAVLRDGGESEGRAVVAFVPEEFELSLMVLVRPPNVPDHTGEGVGALFEVLLPVCAPFGECDFRLDGEGIELE